MPRHSLDRSAYYRMYYQVKKEQIRNRYFEKKETKLREEELYKPYGGEKNYYKSSLINSGVLIIKQF
jgi:hypothetical protein